MRIVFANSRGRLEGGVESYLQTIMPALARAGHEVSLCYEFDQPFQRDRINLPAGTVAWCAAELGLERTLASVRRWRPDVIYCQNLESLALERELLEIAPAVFFAHAYYGTCISGTKSFKQPIARPCHRRFGWQCLLHYYPRRCGGMNPATMLSLYHHQSKRLALLRKYRAVITHSEYLRAEYVSHGVPAERVVCFPYSIKPLRHYASQDPAGAARRRAESHGAWRLVFAGRLDSLKGGAVLLEALPLVRSASGEPLRLVFAGDGPERKKWESAAAALSGSQPDIKVEFAGWLKDAELGALFHTSHLLVVPSLWPEPFGIVGIEAALEGIPAAAFTVGGIPTWLIDGVSGHLASGDPPTAEGLARAIVQCLENGEHYATLCSGAAKIARRFTTEGHVFELIRQLELASQGAREE